ncbi:MAG: zinc ABC transporter substrate-binding protein [Sneathiella sp.]|nr:zinc ABC transporter substrate-binding protein [Sneathiella sp.]
MIRPLFIAILSLLFINGASAAAKGGVVVTLKPLHSLVQGVMGETGEAVLLVTGATSPHGFSLKPSQIRSLQQAAVVFYIDEAIESFLVNALEALPPGVRKYAVAEEAGLDVLGLREGGAWEAHDEHDTHPHAEKTTHDHGADNLHVWLDIGNAGKITLAVAAELGRLYPENSAIYGKNARNLMARLNLLDTGLQAKLAPVRDKPFIVLHDAYPYLERRYGLTAAGSITIEPDQPPSAHRIHEIRQKIEESHAVCIFREPQFDDKLVRTVAEGLPVKLATLDPLGAGLTPGPELYFDLLDGLANDLVECLSK